MKILLLLILSALASYAQVDRLDGLWQGFNGEWRHVSNQLVALAEAIPGDQYTWRLGPGVRPDQTACRSNVP
jgi:hypothetical protein